MKRFILYIAIEGGRISVAEFLDLLNRFMTEVFDVKIFCGIVSAIIVFIFEIRFTRNLRLRNRRVEKATQLGHVVKAKRNKVWDDDTTGYNVDSWFHAAYSYKVDEKSYKYRSVKESREQPKNGALKQAIEK